MSANKKPPEGGFVGRSWGYVHSSSINGDLDDKNTRKLRRALGSSMSWARCDPGRRLSYASTGSGRSFPTRGVLRLNAEFGLPNGSFGRAHIRSEFDSVIRILAEPTAAVSADSVHRKDQVTRSVEFAVLMDCHIRAKRPPCEHDARSRPMRIGFPRRPRP